MKALPLILGLSVVGNLVLGLLYWQRSAAPTPTPVPSSPAIPAAPKLQLENDQFDFSQTTLSDEAWKIEAPVLEPSPPAK